jgi:expansin (peptidoglycan-binding protein)
MAGNAGQAGMGGGSAGTGGVEIINTPGSCQNTWGNQANGSITFYRFDQGTAAAGDVHCSFGIQQNPDRVNHVHTGNGEYFGAMNTADYNTAATCGACVELRRDDGRNVQVTIVDECPIGSNDKCVSGHIDLSRAAFLQVAQESEGFVGQRAGLGSISWNYIPCPTQGNVRIRFVEPNNEFYDGVIVENHRYPIQSVEVWEEGRWVQCQRVAYNFWFTGDTDFGDDPPFYFRVTDINGGVFTVEAPEVSGSQDTGQSQMCQ